MNIAPARQGIEMSALALFRTGRDYIEISAILGMSVPAVESEIHRLRSAEKGDTAQQDYAAGRVRRVAGRPARPGAPVNFAGARRRLRV
ncbi:UNVERIFIED_ORG: DNA-binding CsgD family transcriptional regulator [Rhizobium esperanzae]|nr:DNA-binding CsgD family transcriptional regulator [Rhizobium esperanzae]